MENETLFSLQGISKTFPGVKALDKVALEVTRGEVHAIMGENGAGKSTLMNIISGVYRPDCGEMIWQGRPYRPISPREAQSLGIGFVHQETALCPHLSIAENVFLGRTPQRFLGLVDRKRARAMTLDLLKEFRIGLDPAQPVQRLTVAGQQVVEIIKAISLDCRLLILDEPTSALTEKETDALFGIIERLKSKGISVLYISHRLAEVFKICDRVTVFRDGQYIRTLRSAETCPDEIIALMVGRNIQNLYPPKSTASGRDLLRVDHLTRSGKFRDVSFSVREGEILGFAGLVGAGRTEVARAVCGIDPCQSGQLWVDGQEVRFDNYAKSIAAKVVYVTEDRKTQGLFLQMSIVKNISVAVLQGITRRLVIHEPDEQRVAQEFVRRLRIKTSGINQRVDNLSGGNQQKVMLGKWMATSPRVVFMDEPTRGIDVGAKSEIHSLLREWNRQGIGVILISSELPEIIGMCDRVLVMHEGKISGELTGSDITEENIMRYAAGGSPCMESA